MNKKFKFLLVFTIAFSFIISANSANAGCTKTIQHRKYDARGKLTGFTYERVYSSDCSFYGSAGSTRSSGRRK